MRKKKEIPRSSRERRLDSRVLEEDKVVIELLTNGRPAVAKTIINALTKDISPGGVRIMTNVALPADTVIKMEIALPKRRKLIHVIGTVRWARSVYGDDLFEMGVEFTDISPEAKMILLEHIYKRID